MKPNWRKSKVLAAVASGVLCLAAGLPQVRSVQLVWNASASAPIGLYRVHRDRPPAIGDLVIVHLPADRARFAARRHYISAGVPLLKRIAALPGATVCRRGQTVSIDGTHAAVARVRDTKQRPLPTWHGCRVLRAGEVFVLNQAADSLDSRYFGPLPASGVLGRAIPVVTRGVSGPQPRWHWRTTSWWPFYSLNGK